MRTQKNNNNYKDSFGIARISSIKLQPSPNVHNLIIDFAIHPFCAQFCRILLIYHICDANGWIYIIANAEYIYIRAVFQGHSSTLLNLYVISPKIYTISLSVSFYRVKTLYCMQILFRSTVYTCIPKKHNHNAPFLLLFSIKPSNLWKLLAIIWLFLLCTAGRHINLFFHFGFLLFCFAF